MYPDKIYRSCRKMTIHLCIQIKQVEIFKFFQTMLTIKNSQSLFFNKSKTVVPSLTEIIDMPINVLNMLHQGIKRNGNTFRGDSALFFLCSKANGKSQSCLVCEKSGKSDNCIDTL